MHRTARPGGDLRVRRVPFPVAGPGSAARWRALALAWLALAGLALAAAPARAARVDGLYEGEVTVAGKSDEERTEAVGRALRQVLAKLTGIAQPGGPVVDLAVSEPQRFVQQFRYRDRDDPGAPLALWVRFDRAAVDGLVRDAGLPSWSAQRPGVLAWVAVDRAGTIEVVAPDAGVDEAGVAAALSRHAWQKGVPLAFPLLDLEDRVRVQPDAVWRQDVDLLRQASERYAPGALLVARMQADAAGAWSAYWVFEEGGERVEWETRGLSPADTTTGVLDLIAQRLASRYAISADQSTPGGVEVKVTGVRTLGDYARTLEYLQGLDAVDQLVFSGARGDEFSFRMQVRGGPEALRRMASFGGVLASEPSPGDGSGLRFRLLP